MDLVVDTNVLIAAALRDAFTRRLVLHGPHRLWCPARGFREAREHLPLIAERMGLDTPHPAAVLGLLSSRIEAVPDAAILAHWEEAGAAVGAIDRDDVVFVAAALAVSCDLWSNDKPLRRQRVVRVWSTGELAAL